MLDRPPGRNKTTRFHMVGKRKKASQQGFSCIYTWYLVCIILVAKLNKGCFLNTCFPHHYSLFSKSYFPIKGNAVGIAPACFCTIRYVCKKDALHPTQDLSTVSCILTPSGSVQEEPYAKNAYTCIEIIQQERERRFHQSITTLLLCLLRQTGSFNT